MGLGQNGGRVLGRKEAPSYWVGHLRLWGNVKWGTAREREQPAWLGNEGLNCGHT